MNIAESRVSFSLCTGEFPQLSSGLPLLKPDRLLVNLIRGIADGGVLAAIVPDEKQIPAMLPKWRRTGLEVRAFPLSPYTASGKEVREIAVSVAALEPDLVVLDCMGFGMDIRNVFYEHTGRPVLLPRTILARIAAGIVEG
ncbi:MAG: AroM family protein [Spirochaetales bacterium]|nr:AroM family protein [Spirochaetales bacterium]